MTDYLFTCKACKHWSHTGQVPDSICSHPAIEQMKFSIKREIFAGGAIRTDLTKLTQDDLVKINHLANTILQLQVNPTNLDKRVNFFFPFQYDCIWVTGCAGFDPKKSKQYMFTCKACKHGEYPVIAEGHLSRSHAVGDELERNLCRCHHSEIKMLGISSTDQEKFTLKDWAKINFLIHVILKVKVSQVLPYNRPNFLFPFWYDPAWVEGCDGFEKR